MSFKNNNNKKDNKSFGHHKENNDYDKVLNLIVTKNMAKIGIIEFNIFKHKEEYFINFDFADNQKCHVPYAPRKISATDLFKNIHEKLLQILSSNDDYKGIESACNDIENQIVENRDKVFDVPADANINGSSINNNSNVYQFVYVR